jgi:ABC-type uncharacterized transport system permease subunit
MIKNGDVANILTKPLSFMKYVLAQEATSIINIGVNFVFGIVLGIIMAGKISIEPLQILLFVISLILSLIISMFVSVFVGMMAFITEENQSFYLVISKAMLILVFTPLEFFPKFAQTILRFLPTTYIVYPPGKILVSYDLKTSVILILCQIVSLIVVFLGAYTINMKGVKSINVNGG